MTIEELFNLQTQESRQVFKDFVGDYYVREPTVDDPYNAGLVDSSVISDDMVDACRYYRVAGSLMDKHFLDVPGIGVLKIVGNMASLASQHEEMLTRAFGEMPGQPRPTRQFEAQIDPDLERILNYNPSDRIPVPGTP